MLYLPGATRIQDLVKALAGTNKYSGRLEAPVETSVTDAAGRWVVRAEHRSYAAGAGGKLLLELTTVEGGEVTSVQVAWSGEGLVVGETRPADGSQSGTRAFFAEFQVSTSPRSSELLATAHIEYALAEGGGSLLLPAVIPVEGVVEAPPPVERASRTIPILIGVAACLAGLVAWRLRRDR